MASPFNKQNDHMHVGKAGEIQCTALVPGSKSLTNRFLLLAALADGISEIHHPLDSEDTQYMRKALAQVGVPVEVNEDHWSVTGTPRWRSPAEPIFVGNAGTVMRFFSPALTIGPLEAVVTGNARMCVRPIGDLVSGLRQLGVTVTYQGYDDYPPLKLAGPMQPRSIEIKGNFQFSVPFPAY